MLQLHMGSCCGQNMPRALGQDLSAWVSCSMSASQGRASLSAALQPALPHPPTTHLAVSFNSVHFLCVFPTYFSCASYVCIHSFLYLIIYHSSIVFSSYKNIGAGSVCFVYCCILCTRPMPNIEY